MPRSLIVYTDDEFGAGDAIPQSAFAEVIGRRRPSRASGCT
jgi:hypothetical protein